MNYRDYKKFNRGFIYHIFNRGNNKEPIFLDEQDYYAFLKRLKIILKSPITRESSSLVLKPLPKDSFSILSYCLMPNHFHFQIKQNSDIGINVMISKLCTSYAKYFNKKYNHVGHVFQDAFKARVVNTDSDLLNLSAYIHNNPEDPLDYPYSSFQEYLNPKTKGLTNTDLILSQFSNNKKGYIKFVTNLNAKDPNSLLKEFSDLEGEA